MSMATTRITRSAGGISSGRLTSSPREPILSPKRHHGMTVRSVAGTSAANGKRIPPLRNNQYYVQDVDAILMYDHELPEHVMDFIDNSFDVSDFVSEHQIRLKAMVRKLNSEGSLNGLEEFNRLVVTEARIVASFIWNQIQTQKKPKEYRDGLSKMVDGISWWKTGSDVFFVSWAAISAAAAVLAVNVDPKRIPVAVGAAATSLLFAGAGKICGSRLEEHESRLKKHRSLIAAISFEGNFAIRNLTAIHKSIREVRSQTASILGIVVDDEATEVAVREKREALDQIIRSLQRKTNRCISTLPSARANVLARASKIYLGKARDIAATPGLLRASAES